MSNIFTIKQDIEEFVNENKSLPAKDFLEKLYHLLIEYPELIEEVYPGSYFFRKHADLQNYVYGHIDISI